MIGSLYRIIKAITLVQCKITSKSLGNSVHWYNLETFIHDSSGHVVFQPRLGIPTIYWRWFGVFIVSFKHFSTLFLEFPLWTLKNQMFFGHVLWAIIIAIAISIAIFTVVKIHQCKHDSLCLAMTLLFLATRRS